MGMTFTNLSQEELCELMCGGPEEDKMYECFHCGKRAVIWQNDFSFDEMGYEGDGIVHICHCSNCGAEIEYRIPDLLSTEDDEYADSEE